MKKKKTLAIFISIALAAIAIGFYIRGNQEFAPDFHDQCFSLQYLEEKRLSGTLILMPQNTSDKITSKWHSTDSLFLDLKTGKTRLVDEENPTGQFSISPDGKSLSYIRLNGEQRTLVILDARHREKTLMLSADMLPSGWLNNKQFLLWQKRDAPSLPQTLLLDINTMQIQIILPDEKDAIPYDYRLFWDNLWGNYEIYSPGMKYVLRLKDLPPEDRDKDTKDESFFAKLELSEIGSSSEIRLQGIIQAGDKIIWKQDESGFFWTHNIFTFDRFNLGTKDAKVRFITKNGNAVWELSMAKYLPEYLPQIAIDEVALSPNEQQLAIHARKLVEGVISSEIRLLLLDMLSGDIYSTCLTPDFYSPAWSPNSRYVVLTTTAYTNPDTHMGEGRQVVIVDVYTQQFYEIKDGYVSFGWLDW